jgi:putative addiction module component (TIGR02574 family)
MPFDIKEIKKLPRKEKYKIIGQIWDSIENPPPGIYTKAAAEKLIFERLEAVKQGSSKSDSWENAKKRLMKKSDERLKLHSF